MSLKTYDEKRNFKETAEPKGGKKKPADKEHIFVIQRHHASRLHYDFRLEVDGVLKSWAVPKGPSMNPSDKRLAMQVEDHPYDYKDFEGVIPEGNYGAGFVYVWDKGNYELLHEDGKDFDKEAGKEIREGNLKIRLKGKKLKGEFALVKMKNTDDNAWLLLKHKDNYAVKEAYDSEDYTPKRVKDKGVKEKEKMKTGKKKVTPASAKAATKPKPKTRKELYTPMMATLVDKPFSREGWLFETKWDGYRAIADVKKGKVDLYSRNHLSFNKDYPVVVTALEKLKHDAVLDGEVVILKKDGTSDFQSLQNYKNNATGNLVYVAFDMLQLDGQDLQALPLIQRKELLKEVVAQLKSKTVIYSEHVLDDSEKLYKTAQQKGWEGIIAKESESLYAEGRRSMSWLKIKIVDEQEVIICGYTDPQGSRKKIGSLVLGVYDDDSQLKYVGNCGGGLNGALIDELYTKMQPLRVKSSPFKAKIRTNTPVTWVKPELVCQVKFSSWTSDRHLRQPVFLGLRKDKPASEVHKETAKSTKMATKKAAANTAPAQQNHEKERVVTLNGKKVTLTNQQKLYWPDEKITKGTLLDYYFEMADYVLPYLKDRPLSLHRFPNGINDAGFYQKDIDTATAPEWLKTVQLHAASASRDVDYLVCNNTATLAYMINLGCIEINPWLSRVKNLDNPDYLVLDLDPENIAFKHVVETALSIKALLDKLGVKAFCKTSGASGLHIYVPTGGKYNYETCRLFAEYVAKQVQQELPDITSVIRTKSKRNKKVYIDYMQNSRGQTIASPYSVRPKPGATVSAPLNWDELTEDLAIADFTIENMAARVKEVGDLWKDIDKTKNDLRKAINGIEEMAQADVE